MMPLCAFLPLPSNRRSTRMFALLLLREQEALILGGDAATGKASNATLDQGDPIEPDVPIIGHGRLSVWTVFLHKAHWYPLSASQTCARKDAPNGATYI